MGKPLYIWISLIDCIQMTIASWPYDEQFPVIPPRFTYPNESRANPYCLQFHYTSHSDRIVLPAGMDLNLAIDQATREYVAGVHDG